MANFQKIRLSKIDNLAAEIDSAHMMIHMVEPDTSYLAWTYTMPEIGSRLHCVRFEYDWAGFKIQPVDTSSVVSIEPLSRNVFKVRTMNTFYVLRVMSIDDDQHVTFVVTYTTPVENRANHMVRLALDNAGHLKGIPFQTGIIAYSEFKSGLHYTKDRDGHTYVCLPVK